MCIICVEIARGRITVREGDDALKEVFRSGRSPTQHERDLSEAIHSGNDKEIQRVVKAGEKQERWI